MKNYTNELYLFYSAFIIRDCLYWHRYRKREFEGEGKIWKNVQRYRHCCQGISEWDSPIDGVVFNGKSPIEKMPFVGQPYTLMPYQHCLFYIKEGF